MNKFTLDFFRTKSKTAIKGLFVLFAFLLMNTQTSWGQLLQWNTLNNLGTETTEPSTANDANIAAANLTQSGITGGSNSNRFGGSGWFDAGNTNPSTLANAIAGNNYIQFVVTPNSGYSFTPTSFVFKWDRSSTGPSAVTLRSSADNYAADLGSVTGMASGGTATSTDRTITITGLTNITTATTFRIYAYGATAASGTGGFDCATGSTVNVALNGTVASSVVSAPVINNVSFTASTTVLAENTNIYAVTATNTPSSFSATGLPTGLSINPTTGVISGTPATGTAALSPYTVVLQASNSGGDSATENLTLTINKANQTITFTPTLITKAIGDTPVTLTASSTSGLAVSYGTSDSGVASLSGSTLSFVGAGTATITASQAGNVDYNAATSVTQDQVVSAAPLSNQTITFGALTPVTYGDTFELTATADSLLPVTYASSNTAVATVSGTTVTIVGAGSTNITASQAGNGSFNPAADVIQALTVNAKALTISGATAASRAYNALLTTNITGTLTGIINSDDVTFDGTLKGTFADANVADGIAVTSACTLAGTKAGNYALTQPIGMTADITQASQTITFGTLSSIGIGTTLTLSATGGASGNAVTYTSSDPAIASISGGNIVTGVANGTVTITASQLGNSNYAAATDVPQSLTIAVVPVVYNFGTATGTAAPTSGAIANLSYGNFTTGNSVTPANAVINSTSASSGYDGASANNNYAIVTQRGAAFSTSTAAYYEVTITPASGFGVNLNSLSFASRGTSSGATNIEIYTSADNYTTAISSFTVSNNSTWALNSPSISSVSSSSPLIIRIYGYNPIGTLLTSGSAANFRIDDVSISATASNTTTYTTSWDYGTPTAAINAVIDGNLSSTGSLSAKSLTVNATKTLTVASGSVTVAEAIVNNGTITVENNASLVQTTGSTYSGSGTSTVKRNSSPLYILDYTMWSSPVSGTQTLAQFSPMTSIDPYIRFYTYNPVSNKYANAAPTSTFATGIGYLIRMPKSDNTNYNAGTAPLTYNGQFTGIPNNGTLTLSGLTADKFYAVGNPYPSTISADAFINGNSTAGTLYFWRKRNAQEGSAYATYNLVGTTVTASASSNGSTVVPNGNIQVGQGFIVKTGVAATSLAFTNAMRVANNDNQFFKTKQVQKDRVWLNMRRPATITGTIDIPEAFSQALIGYMDGATLGVDEGIDGKYINDSPVALTSSINDEEYTIQGRPAFDPSDVVALNFKTDADGEYTIALDHFDGVFAAGQDVYLVDSKTGTETDLKAGAYTFNATSGIDNARFSLKYQKTLKVGTPDFNENSVSVYKNNGALYVNSGFNAMSNIKVFDIQGRLIAEQKNLKSTTAVFNNLKAKNQVLIVKIAGENNNVVSKKILN